MTHRPKPWAEAMAISLRFSISQHSRDVLLLESLVLYFGCGYVAKYDKRSVCEFIVTTINHIVENIIPFFDKHPTIVNCIVFIKQVMIMIVGSKHLNYLNFKKAAIIIKNKEHLNPDRKGLEQLLV
jgi:hypothetical protein